MQTKPNSKTSLLLEKTSPLVFLDFDDVLAIHAEYTSYQVVTAFKLGASENFPELWELVFDKQAKTNLKTLAEEFSPQFVISSSWAAYLSRGQVRELLNRTGLGFVDSRLAKRWRTFEVHGTSRATEIINWLKKAPQGQSRPFVVLDDTGSGHSLPSSELGGRSVLCQQWHGFLSEELSKAQAILREQLV